jgi:nicotinate-nucleotide pyrophosphorylase (carboxylating)
MPDASRITPAALRNLVREALAEDIGSGDATTLAVVPAEHRLTAQLRSRQTCVLAGLVVAETVFAELDPAVRLTRLAADGDTCQPGDILATITGPARAILTGERTALNYLQRLSGIATLTRRSRATR